MRGDCAQLCWCEKSVQGANSGGTGSESLLLCSEQVHVATAFHWGRWAVYVLFGETSIGTLACLLMTACGGAVSVPRRGSLRALSVGWCELCVCMSLAGVLLYLGCTWVFVCSCIWRIIRHCCASLLLIRQGGCKSHAQVV